MVRKPGVFPLRMLSWLSILLEVPPDRSYNYCMMNKKDVMECFVIGVSEMIAAYNERGMSYDMNKLCSEKFHDLEMKTEWLPEAADMFDFNDPDAGWTVVECGGIMRWIAKTCLS